MRPMQLHSQSSWYDSLITGTMVAGRPRRKPRDQSRKPSKQRKKRARKLLRQSYLAVILRSQTRFYHAASDYFLSLMACSLTIRYLDYIIYTHIHPTAALVLTNIVNQYAPERYYQNPSSASPPFFFLPPLVCARACRSYISAIWKIYP